MSAVPGVISTGHKGRLEVIAELPAAVLPLGATRYESRHGDGTAGGFYPLVPSSGNWTDGDRVTVTRVVRVIDIPSAPVWARKLFVVEVIADAAAQQQVAARSAAAAAAEAARAELIHALRYGSAREIREAMTDMDADTTTRLLSRGYGRRVRWSAVIADASQLMDHDKIGAYQTAGGICVATHKPTLAFRSLPKNW